MRLQQPVCGEDLLFLAFMGTGGNPYRAIPEKSPALIDWKVCPPETATGTLLAAFVPLPSSPQVFWPQQ